MKKIAAILTLLLLVATSASAMILAGVLSSYRAPQAPNAPTGVTATAGNTQNTVNWTDGTGPGDPATSYTLYGGTSASPTSSIYSGSGTSYTHTGLTNGTPYYYRLTASNAAGTSGYSSPDATATPLGALVPFYPDFETAGAVAATTTAPSWQDEIAATSAARWDGWWGERMTTNASTGTITSIVDRYANAEMTGSYVGRVTASGTAASDYFASLMTRKTKTAIDATNGVITFDVRPKVISTSAYSYAIVKVIPIDAAGNKLITTGAISDSITLWKGSSATAYNSTLMMISSPVVNTTYTKSMNVKTFAMTHLDSGKSWSDVNMVILEFVAYTTDGSVNSFYIDNFR